MIFNSKGKEKGKESKYKDIGVVEEAKSQEWATVDDAAKKEERLKVLQQKPIETGKKLKTEAEILKERAKRAKQKERFIRIRMWMSILSSKYFRDRGSIPSNIGNNIFIGNNQITTKNFMTCAIYINEFSMKTPIGFQSQLISRVRNSVKNATVDFTTKMYRYQPELSKSGMSSRETQWKRTLDAPLVPSYLKERSARCLYTMDVLRQRTKCFKTHNYILVRSNNGNDLDLAVSAVRSYLYELEIKHKEIRDDMELHFKYICMMSDSRDAKLKDLNSTILSTRTLAELLPNLQGVNDKKGFLLGFDTINNSAYYIDERKSSGAKNIAIIGPSGGGKTFLCLTWCQDRYNSGYNLLIRDLKGNEFSVLTEAYQGITLSLSENDLYYINFFNMTDLVEEGNSNEFRKRVGLCEELIRRVVNPSVENNDETSMLISIFMSTMLRSMGIVEGNPHTWKRTADLNPYVVYDKFLSFAGPELREKYDKLIEYMSSRMSMYMSKSGSKSHIFRMPINVRDFRKTRCLRFDFGMLDTKASYDETSFKIKFFFSEYVADDFIAYKKSLEEATLIVNEEAQLAEDYVAASCKKDGTMRRSQNVMQVLLCNSVVSIAERPDFRAVLNNTKILAIGAVTDDDRKYLINQYSLEKYRKALTSIADNPKYYRTFLLVNKLQPNATTALLQACVPEDIAKGKMYTVVDVDKDTESVSGIAQANVSRRFLRGRNKK